MKWILVLIFIVDSSPDRPAIVNVQHEFSSKASCQKAGKEWVNQSRYIHTEYNRIIHYGRYACIPVK